MRTHRPHHPILPSTFRPLLVLALLVGLLAAVPTAARASHHFDDVPDDHPFHAAISWLVDEGVASGYPDGTFRPAADVTRQAVAAFLHRMAGEPAVTVGSGFSDVPVSHPFHDAIAWAADRGIAAGYPDGTFRPAANVTRQAAAAFVFRAVAAPEEEREVDFTDVPGDHPFQGPIAWMADEGIAAGYPDGTFRPAAAVTRQAIAAFLERTVDAGHVVRSGELALTLSPSAAVVEAAQAHTLSATVQDVVGVAAPDGTFVRFEVSDGDEVRATEVVDTTAGGAAFTYSLPEDERGDGRQDTVVACVVADPADGCAGASVSAEASVTWVPAPDLAGTDVLYVVDDVEGTDHLRLGLEALAGDGVIDLTVASSHADAVTRMEEGDHDVVVYLNQAFGLPADSVAALVDWVDAGGRAIVSDWQRTTDLLAAFEAERGTSTNESPATITDPRLALGVADPLVLTNPPDGWEIWSAGLAPATGTDAVSLCTFPSGDACAVNGNDGRTIALSFLSDTIPAEDGRNLARNLLRIVME